MQIEWVLISNEGSDHPLAFGGIYICNPIGSDMRRSPSRKYTLSNLFYLFFIEKYIIFE